jgi:hypothetical protein
MLKCNEMFYFYELRTFEHPSTTKELCKCGFSLKEIYSGTIPTDDYFVMLMMNLGNEFE